MNIISAFALSQQLHPDPDPEFRVPRYEPRTHLMPSSVEVQLAGERTLSDAEILQINGVVRKVQEPTFYPIDRTQPLCGVFKPDSQDQPLLWECARLKTPEPLFPPQWNRGSVQCARYIHIRHRDTLLLQTDGACIDNGSTRPGRLPRAGYAFVYGPPLPNAPAHGIYSRKLDSADATNNRAELIAIIATLRARIWWGEGFYKVVVATDSEYVVKGCTEWCRTWQSRKWKTASNQAVKNRDLWEELIWNIEFMRHRGCEVMFWQIPREWNTKADSAAKRAAGDE